MVSIPDFESGNPGSNPGETYNLTILEQWTVNPFVECLSILINSENMSVWRNWIAHQTSNLGVAGSSPVMDIFLSGYPSLVKGVRLKIACEMLRGFKSHT